MSEPPDRSAAHDEQRVAWSGCLAFGPWWLVYSGPVGPTDEHAHHAFQIVVHAGSPLVSETAGHLCSGPIVIVKPDHVHAFCGQRQHVLVIFIDPESSVGLSLGRHGESLAATPASHPVSTLLGGLRPRSWSQAEEAVRRSLRAISPLLPTPATVEPRHPAVERALQVLPDIVREGVVDVGRLADHAGISTSRLSHLFTAEVGMPVITYARWLRLIAATEELAGGSNITEAAHRAGFSDGSHFSHTFREMFGLAPSEAVGLGKWLTP